VIVVVAPDCGELGAFTVKVDTTQVVARTRVNLAGAVK
jgi:hypothetical protein